MFELLAPGKGLLQNELFKYIGKELKIPIINIHKEVFEKESDPFKLFVFGIEEHVHYNIEGYRKISEKVHSIVSKY